MLGYHILCNNKCLYVKSECDEMEILNFINRDLIDYNCRNYVYDKTNHFRVDIFYSYSSVELEDDNGNVIKKVCYEQFVDALDFIESRPDNEKWCINGRSVCLCSFKNKDINVNQDGALQIENARKDYVRKLLSECKLSIDGCEESAMSGNITKNVKETVKEQVSINECKKEGISLC